MRPNPTHQFVLALAMFLEAAGYGIVAPTLPLLARRLGVGAEELGVLFSLYACVGVALVIPFGYAADRWGRRSLMILGLASLLAASAGYMMADDFLWLAVARATQGMGGTAIWVASLSMGGDLSARESAGREVSWITGAWSLGFLLGPALGGLGDLHLPFVLYAGVCLVALVLGALGLVETHVEPIHLSMPRLAALAVRPPIVCSTLATFALAFYYGAFDAFTPWLLDSHGESRASIALLFSVLAIPSVLLPRLCGESADRMGDRAILNFGLPTNGLLAIGFLELVNRFPLWIGFLALGITEVAIYIPAIAMLQRAVDNRERGTAMALHIFAFSTGFVAGPVLSGQLYPHFGYKGIFLMMGGVMLAALLVGNLIQSRAGTAPPSMGGSRDGEPLPELVQTHEPAPDLAPLIRRI
jgi:MFS family permease